MWPDLMEVIRETISIDIADKDGEDLIESMQIKRRISIVTSLCKKASSM